MITKMSRVGRAAGSLPPDSAVAACAGAGATLPGVYPLGSDGELEVLTYSDFPDVSEFGDAAIFYVVDP